MNGKIQTLAVMGTLAGVMALPDTSAAQQMSLNALEAGGDKLLYEYLMAEVCRHDAERLKAVEAALQSPQALAARQKQLRSYYRDILGELPEKTALNARVTGTIECDEYRIEKVIYESRPRHRVTAAISTSPSEEKARIPASWWPVAIQPTGRHFPPTRLSRR